MMFIRQGASTDSAPQAQPGSTQRAQAARDERPSSVSPMRVLFVGNSFTFQNDLPGLITQLARSAGKRPLAAQQNTIGGWGLREHLDSGRVQQRLTERWDFVVLQDQSQRPSFTGERRKQWFEDPARTLVTAIKAAGPRVLLYQTFARREGDRESIPTDTFEAMHARLQDGFGTLASELGVEIVPVGAIWAQLHQSHPQLNLWAP